MGLALYNSEQVTSADMVFRPVINGRLGGSHEELFYLRNDDVTKWYSNVRIVLVSTAYDGLGELGSTGIGFKFMYGERQPTEAEWDTVPSGEGLLIPDIGTNDLADTYTYHPFWVRVFVPGNTGADIIESYDIRIYFYPRVVGV